MAGYANPFEAQTQTQTPDPTTFNEDYYLNSDPDAAFWKYLQGQGYGMGQSAPQARYAQARQQQTYNTYKSEAAQDVNMGFWDWLKGKHPDFGAEFQAQSPDQRGDFSSRILTPRARWVG